MVKFNLKKKIAKALVFAMVMGTVGVHGLSLKSPVTVMAEEPEVEKVELSIDYVNFTATITPTSKDKYVFLEVYKDKEGKKVSATYPYEVKFGGTTTKPVAQKVVIDISFLKATKESYIRAYGDANMKDSYSDIETIAAQPVKKKITFVAGKDPEGTNEIAKVKESFSGDDITLYEYKTLYGSTWNEFEYTAAGGTASKPIPEKGFNLANASVSGTTIIIRKKAVNESEGEGGTKTPGAPAGVEMKIKITANPKAPKIKVDYVKGTVKIGKNMQIKTVDSTGKWINVEAKDWTIDELKKKLVNECPALAPAKGSTEPANKKFTLLVRNAESGKKAASLPTFVVIDELEVLNAIVVDNTQTGDILITENDKHSKETVTVVSEDPSTRKLKYEATTKGVKLTAEGASFEYYDSKKEKWNTVTTGKAVDVALDDLTQLKVRLAGVKPSKDGEGAAFASVETTLPKIKLVPAAVTISGSAKCTEGEQLTFEMKAVDGNKKSISIAAKTGSKGSSTVPATPMVVADTVEWTPEDTNNFTLTTSQDGSTATYTFKKAGTYTIKVKFRGVEGTVSVTVAAPPTSATTN